MEWKDLEGGGLVVPDQGGPHDQVPTTTIATIGSLGPNPSGGKGFPSEKKYFASYFRDIRCRNQERDILYNISVWIYYEQRESLSFNVSLASRMISAKLQTLFKFIISTVGALVVVTV